jgi:hypothetical protein
VIDARQMTASKTEGVGHPHFKRFGNFRATAM